MATLGWAKHHDGTRSTNVSDEGTSNMSDSDVLWNDPPARDTVVVHDTLYLPKPCHHHCN